MQRRDLLKLAAVGGAALAVQPLAAAYDSPGPVLDAHIHLFDPTRPGGVLWPEKSDTVLYKPALPDRYATIAKPFGVVGAIAIEASPLAADNDWLLKIAAANPIIVGVVGDLIPDAPGYRHDLDRLQKDPLFLGFRYGNLWDRNLASDLHKPGFLDGLKAVAQSGLVFESANPDAALIGALGEIGNRIPNLRIVVDHLPHAVMPTEPAALRQYQADLRRLAQNPKVFVKLSEIPVLKDDKLVSDPDFYRPALDVLWDRFGEDRLLFGSDWPNSDHVAGYGETFAIVRRYLSTKGQAAMRKFFANNSKRAYRWTGRTADQRQL
jgi:predicted TIM-barrel fold metal-dependent hydrolase